MNSKGYTIPELIIIIVVMGIISLFAINKVSYALEDTEVNMEQTREMILIKSATVYANSIIDSLKEKEAYITGKDLTEAEYLVDDDRIYANEKIKLSYNAETDSVSVEILK